jgi:hypothetical protein
MAENQIRTEALSRQVSVASHRRWLLQRYRTLAGSLQQQAAMEKRHE